MERDGNCPLGKRGGFGGQGGEDWTKSGGSLYWVDCGQEDTVSGWNGRAGGEWSEDNLGKASSATGRLLRSAEFPGVLVLSTGLGALGGRERRGRRQKSLLPVYFYRPGSDRNHTQRKGGSARRAGSPPPHWGRKRIELQRWENMDAGSRKQESRTMER